MNAFLEHIGSQLGASIQSAQPLAGGDINDVYCLETAKGRFVLKSNRNPQLPDLFEKEAMGLLLLAQSNSFRIPQVIRCGHWNGIAFLLLEYIPTVPATNPFWESFAGCLVRLHQNHDELFGLEEHNYLGSLIQYNYRKEDAAEFYISQRLEPQFKMARDHGFSLGNLHGFLKTIAGLIPQEPPSLVHGDLWNGNYLVADSLTPALIDPAVAFASREMDLAMMRLFGGFPHTVFHTYEERFPLQAEWESRIPLWQLYYILAHLNLFGASYLAQTKEIISRFS